MAFLQQKLLHVVYVVNYNTGFHDKSKHFRQKFAKIAEKM
jgi:hypothetical protein